MDPTAVHEKPAEEFGRKVTEMKLLRSITISTEYLTPSENIYHSLAGQNNNNTKSRNSIGRNFVI